jgi:conjugative transposon TraN protein
MKKILFTLSIIFSAKCFSQAVIGCYPFTVTANMTSNIVFPYPVKTVDRGSPDLLVQKAKGAENILQLKAAKENFSTTTLSVITADGRLYPFMVSYETQPKIFNLSFIKGEGKPFVMLSDEIEDAATLDSDAAQVLALPEFLSRHANSMKMHLALNSIYIKDHLLWFALTMENHSQLPFTPEYIHFFIRDRSKARRTAMQERELTPVYIQNTGAIGSNSKIEFACAFNLFTIARDKKMVFEVNEQNGGRLVKLNIPQRTILKARVFGNKK